MICDDIIYVILSYFDDINELHAISTALNYKGSFPHVYIHFGGVQLFLLIGKERFKKITVGDSIYGWIKYQEGMNRLKYSA